MKYRKKPVVIDAEIWNPEDLVGAGKIAAWLQMNNVPFRVLSSKGLYIGTLEDGDGESAQVEHVASPGDYIIRGLAGEFYPCKAAIFLQSYEPVEPRGRRPNDTPAAYCYDDAKERAEAMGRSECRDYNP